MSIRLDAIPITGLPQIVKSDAPQPYGARVNCVLHSGPLPVFQHLEVRVNGVVQQGVQEGAQMVFSWQFVQASEEVHVQLLSRGVLHQRWQGCWNERDAILHMGTLPVQVFFNGKLQPMVPVIGGLSSAATLAALRLPNESGGGNGWNEGDGSASESGAHAGGQNGEAQHGTPVVVHDLLVTATPSTPSVPQQERGAALQASSNEWQAREESRSDVEKEMELEEEETPMAEDEEAIEPEEDEPRFAGVAEEVKLEEEETPFVEYEEEEELGTEEELSLVENEEDAGSSEEESEHFIDPGVTESPVIQEEQCRETEAPATTRMRVAAFHAGPLSLEETLQALQTLVASMSPKTIIVDLRHHSRSPGRNREQGGLSQKLLRSVFGGKYWDRSWAIEITYRGVSSTGRSSISQWRRVVAHPDHHSEGIPSLVSHLREGYSMVVMDSIANYEDSLRKAVIDELEHRLPGLEVGPVG